MTKQLKKRTLHRRYRNGVVLVGLMMVLFLILAIGLIGIAGTASGSMSDSTTGSLRLTRMRNNTYQAQILADNGVRAVAQWLNGLSSAPTNTTSFRPSEVSTFGYLNTSTNGNYDRITFKDPNGVTIGTIDVRVFPFSDNGAVVSKSYMIESVGTYNGMKQIVQASIIQDSFAKYAFFSDNAPRGTFWTAGSTIFNGPVHVNASNMDTTSANYDPKAALNILWKNTANNQLFKYAGDGAFTTSAAANQLTWYKNNRSTIAAPASTSDWNYVAAGGQSTIKTGVAKVDMPTQSTRQSDAALGNPPATIPGSPGVVVPGSGGVTSGGVYINGNVDNMRLTASGTNNVIQGIEIYQNDGVKNIKTVVTIDPTLGSNGQVKVQRFTTTDLVSTTYTEQTTGGYPQTLTGRTNGVVYINGNVGKPSVPPLNADGSVNTDGTPTTFATGGISGKLANNVVSGSTVTKQSNLNIVTDANSTMNICGDIVYASMSGSNTTSSTGILGLVAGKVQLIQNLTNDDQGDGVDNVTVHATVMAYDTFNAENPLVRNYLALKTFNLLGGYIVKNPGTFTGIDSTGTALTGFTVNRNYDSRVAATPPPFYPSTGNQYKLRSYQRVASTL